MNTCTHQHPFSRSWKRVERWRDKMMNSSSEKKLLFHTNTHTHTEFKQMKTGFFAFKFFLSFFSSSLLPTVWSWLLSCDWNLFLFLSVLLFNLLQFFFLFATPKRKDLCVFVFIVYYSYYHFFSFLSSAFRQKWQLDAVEWCFYLNILYILLINYFNNLWLIIIMDNNNNDW